MTDEKAKCTKAKEINKILAFVLYILASKCSHRTIFNFMNTKLFDERNRYNVDLMKAELQLSVNFGHTCQEFVKFIKIDHKL